MRALGTRLVASQFISHRSAALLWGAPLPHRDRADLHVSTIAPARAPRIQNVTGHSFPQHRVKLGCVEGIAVAAPASVFVSMGSLPLADLVALGDYFVRKHRPGHGRPNAGRASLATVAELAEMVDLGRWLGAPRLRQALSLVREDSWSPRESSTRLVLVLAGLPEPDLNIDVFDRSGYFLGCIDIAYSKYKVAVEYQGQQHAATYAADIERIERLRAEGWEVIQVTAALAARPRALVDRVANALHRRGWSGL